MAEFLNDLNRLSKLFRMYKRVIILLLILAGMCMPVAGKNYVPVAKDSKIQFKIVQNKETGVIIRGTLGNIKGNISFDPAHPEKSNFDVTVGSETAHSSDINKDAQLKGIDFFDAAHYPVIRFKSVSIKQDRPGSMVYIADGNLTIKGITKPVHIQFTVLPKGADYLFRGLLDLNRLTYNLGKKDELAEDVSVFLEVMAHEK